MTAPTVRLLTLEDVAILRELRLRGCKEEPGAFLEDYDDLLARPIERFKRHFEGTWLAGAFIDGKLVGMTGLSRSKGRKLEHKGLVWGVYVVPQARGRKLARRMLELVIGEAQNAGLELLMISTAVTNKTTVHLYQSLGFAPCGIEMHVIKLADGSYVDDVQMIKFLKE